MLDERGTVMYANHEFMHEVRPRCLEWKALVKMAYSIARRELMNAYGLKDRITLAVNSGSSAVTLEPVVSGSRLILVIEIHDRINVPSIIPREREINRHNITILHTPLWATGGSRGRVGGMTLYTAPSSREYRDFSASGSPAGRSIP